MEDFVGAMADANGARPRPSSCAGTVRRARPSCNCKLTYSAAKKTVKLAVKQSAGPTPGQPEKLPFHIPLKIGLLGADGRDMPLKLAGGADLEDGLLNVREPSQTFDFEEVFERPTPSLLRGFSAPVRLTSSLTNRDLEFLMGHDRDLFNRWEAGQTLAAKSLIGMTESVRQGKSVASGRQLREGAGEDHRR